MTRFQNQDTTSGLNKFFRLGTEVNGHHLHLHRDLQYKNWTITLTSAEYHKVSLSLNIKV